MYGSGAFFGFMWTNPGASVYLSEDSIFLGICRIMSLSRDKEFFFVKYLLFYNKYFPNFALFTFKTNLYGNQDQRQANA
ncbi:hypothetical protein GCM10009415_43690 [Chitinophaga japonensis]